MTERRILAFVAAGAIALGNVNGNSVIPTASKAVEMFSTVGGYVPNLKPLRGKVNGITKKIPGVPTDINNIGAGDLMEKVKVLEYVPELDDIAVPELDHIALGKLDTLSLGAAKAAPVKGTDWRHFLPTDYDWRTYLPSDFKWEKYVPIEFDWAAYLPERFPKIPVNYLAWEDLIDNGFDWLLLKHEMKDFWIEPIQDRLHENFGHLGLFGEKIATKKGIDMGGSLQDFFTFNKVLNGDFDWRNYLKPGFDLRHYLLSGYDIKAFFPDGINWHTFLPTNVDWRQYIPHDFDWLNFLNKDMGDLLPNKLNWKQIVPMNLPTGFDWHPFLLSMIHWRDYFPQTFSWHDILSYFPGKTPWMDQLHDLDWDHVGDYVHTIPSKFQFHHYMSQIAERFHDIVGDGYDMPSTYHHFLAQLWGILDWNKSVGDLGDYKPTLALLNILKLDPHVFKGDVDVLQLAYLKQMGLSWFK